MITLFSIRQAQLKLTAFFALCITASAGAFSPVLAEGASETKTPVVVEFFTSQSCRSCIPAAKYFRQLADRDDVVALSWHVDYWNTLQTRKGNWVDPYSDKNCTKRQRKYNINLRKRNSVFTPQMVISGAAEAVGSEEETVNKLIDDVSAQLAPVAISAEQAADGAITFTVGENQNGGNAYLVTFMPEIMTDVTGGENKGRQYYGINAVKNLQSLGAVRSVGASVTVAPPEEGYGCALIVQEPNQGRIITAQYCPSS